VRLVAGKTPDDSPRTSARENWRARAAVGVVIALGAAYVVMDFLGLREPSGPVPGWVFLLMLVGALILATYAAILTATTQRRA